MPAKQEIRRQIMIPPELWDKVQLVARSDMTNCSDVVRTALRDYINKRIADARAAKTVPVAAAGGSG